MKDAKPCAAILWTHRGLDRDRITDKTPLNEAIAQSVTLRAQYEAALNMARQMKCEIKKVFLFEETGHLPTHKVFPTINRAISWCHKHDAPLIIHSFRSYSGRGFTSFRVGLVKFEAEINRYGVYVSWINPTEPDESLLDHFERKRNIERECRRRNILKIQQAKGLRRYVAAGGKLGFSAEWEGKKAAREKGIATQIDNAKTHASYILSTVNHLIDERKGVTFADLAEILNIEMRSRPELCPVRAQSWTEYSLRRYVTRHRKSSVAPSSGTSY